MKHLFFYRPLSCMYCAVQTDFEVKEQFFRLINPLSSGSTFLSVLHLTLQLFNLIGYKKVKTYSKAISIYGTTDSNHKVFQLTRWS